MKKFYAILESSLLLFMLCSCSEDAIAPTPGAPEMPTEPKLELELQYTEVNLPCHGGSVSVNVLTNQDDWKAVSTDTKWLTVETSGDKIVLHADKANTTGAKLSTIVTVTADINGNTISRQLTVYQNTDAMIFEYTVDAGNNIRLPISGKVDCIINWGDGREETCKEENIDNFMTMSPTHTYYMAGTFQVSISGEVAALRTGLGFTVEQSSYLTSVIQWGNVGLVSLNSAFSYFGNLQTIPNDDDLAFRDVLSFSNAFSNTGLREIPENLFRNATQATDFNNVFSSTAITKIPAKLFANCISAQKMLGVFGYTKITEIPEELFANCPQITIFMSCFTACSYVRSLPEKLFYNNPLAEDFSYIFRDCSALTSIPENLFSKNPEAGNMVGLFTFCYSLTSIPAKLFANNPKAYKFTYAFANCTSLKSMPAELFDNCRKVLSFQGALRECLSVTGETPYTVIDGRKIHLYERSNYPAYFTAPETGESCFRNSSGFTDYEIIKTQYPLWVK